MAKIWILFLICWFCESRSEAQTIFTVGFEPSLDGNQNFATLSEALDAVNTMEGRYEIWVKRGQYAEGELLVFGNVEMYGGFRGNERRRDQRSTNADLTMLDGGLTHRVACVSGLIDGFRIENGRTNDVGGGIRLIGGIVQNCIIQNNEAKESGGGIYCEGFRNVVQNCVVRYNVCANDTVVITGLWQGKGNTLRGFRK